MRGNNIEVKQENAPPSIFHKRANSIRLLQLIAVALSLFILWCHSTLPRELAFYVLRGTEISAITLGVSIFLTFQNFLSNHSTKANSPSIFNTVIAVVGMLAFFRLAMINDQLSFEASFLGVFDVITAITGIFLLVAATQKSMKRIFALSIAIAIALLFLKSSSFETNYFNEISFTKTVHHLWTSSDGILGLQMSIWINLLFPSVMLGVLLDRHIISSIMERDAVQQPQDSFVDRTQSQPSNWPNIYVFSWCIGFLSLFQISLARTVGSFPLWKILIPTASLLFLIALILTTALCLKSRLSENQANLFRRISSSSPKALEVLHSSGIILFCSLTLFSLLLMTNSYVFISGLIGINSWIMAMFFAVLAAIWSFLFHKWSNQNWLLAWPRLIPIAVTLTALFWFISVSGHSPAFSAVLTIFSFISFKMLDGVFRGGLFGALQSIVDGFIDAMRKTLPGTLIVATAGLIIATAKFVITVEGF